MPIRTLHKAISLEALVDESFSKLAAKDRDKVVAALIKANPTLEGKSSLQPGTVIAIPVVEGVKAQPVSSADGADPVDAVRGVIADALGEYGARLVRRYEEYQAALKEQQTLLKDPELRRALANRPDAAELVPGIEAALKERTKAAATASKEVADAVKRLTKTLDSF